MNLNQIASKIRYVLITEKLYLDFSFLKKNNIMKAIKTVSNVNLCFKQTQNKDNINSTKNLDREKNLHITHQVYGVKPSLKDNNLSQNIDVLDVSSINNSNDMINNLGFFASYGDTEGLNKLANIALLNNSDGIKSEQILFDIFSGKKKNVSNVDDEIKNICFHLYETSKLSQQNKFCYPSKLLYMASSGIQDPIEKNKVTTIILGEYLSQCEHETTQDSDLWDKTRMLMSDEISLATQHIQEVNINYPIGLINPVSNDNLLREIIEEQTKKHDYLEKMELFPVNTGNHWILFALYKKGNEVKSLVFNSFHDLNYEIKRNLLNSAKSAGVTEQNIIFLEKNLQKNVPNGCGLFVIEAIKEIIKNQDKDPTFILAKFISYFNGLSSEQQSEFNVFSRRQAHEFLLN